MPAPTPVRELIRRGLLERAPFGSYQERVELFDPFLRRPVLAATLDPSTINQAALRLYTGASKAWNISGSNAADAGSALDVDGGVALATAGGDDDQMILSPAAAINSVDQSAWGVIEWEPEHAPRLEWTIELPSIEDVLVHAGFGLTAALDQTTDDDQVKLVFNTEGSVSTTNWTAAISIDGSDDEVDTGIAALAAKTIRLGIEVNTNRVPRLYINGTKVATLDALTEGANLIPFCGIQALTDSAKTIKVRSARASRLLTPAA